MTIRPDPGQSMPRLIEKSRRAIELESAAQNAAIEAIYADRKPTSPGALDEKGWKTAPPKQKRFRRALVNQGLDAARLIRASAYDHLVNLGRLLGSDGTVSLYAHTTLSRSACEAAVRLAWQLDVCVDYETRLLRGAQEVYDGALMQLKGHRELPAGQDFDDVRPRLIEQSEGYLAYVERMIDSAGITRVADRNGRKIARLELADVSVPMKFETAPLMARLIPEYPSWYTTSSGTAHSLTWTLASSRRTVGDELVLEVNLFDVGAAALAAIAASALVVTSYARYYGVDPDQFSRASRQRRTMVDRLMVEHGRALAARGAP